MLTEVPSSRPLTGTIVRFCRFARERGLSASVQETMGALEAVATLGLHDLEQLKFGLRSTLCASKDDWDLFEECFQEFWIEESKSPLRRASDRQVGRTRRDAGPKQVSIMATGSGDGDDQSEEGGGQAVAGASARERLTKADFSTLPKNDLALLEHIALRLFKLMSRRLARRKRLAGAHAQIDLRRTIRRNISHGGDPITLQHRGKKPRPHRLVMLLDVSGSMSAYSLFLLKFLYVLQKHFRHVDTFLFSTGLVDITSSFHSHRLDDALQTLSQQAIGWSGGTQIGASLRELNHRYGRKLRSSDTLFLILSDGWDTGEASTLSAELATIKRHVRKLIWLNPLLGMSDYQPVTRGMSAALPYIDVFAPAHNLESLLALEKYL